MCIRCLAKSSAVSGGARQLLNSWQCSLGAAEAAPKVAGARLFSSAMPEPVVDAPAPNSIDGKVAHPSLLNQDLLKAQVNPPASLLCRGLGAAGAEGP
jgi:hypothetical protein